MTAGNRHNLQDVFLNQLRKDNVPVVIYLTNGVKLRGVVKGFDNFVVVLKEANQQLIYKHAIASIVPDKSFNININPEG